MKVMPIRYVQDIETTERFYAVLGLSADRRSSSGGWSELTAQGGLVGLHSAATADPPQRPGAVELVLVSEAPLEEVARRLDEAGYAHDPVAEEAFGRVMRVVDPDGLTLQVREHDSSPYT